MKIASVIGVRPHFIKLFPLSKALEKRHQEIIIHTGQHYSYEMSEVFLQELGLPVPHYNLNIGSGLHGEQTGRMLIEIEKVFLKEKPDVVVVFGDTNSTLAGAIAASKLHIPIAHVEAGVRSYNRNMPEEINRVLTDHLSSLLFCPTSVAINNLLREGITQNVHCVGDIMLDAALFFGAKANDYVDILSRMKLNPNQYLLATIHRPSNTDSRENLTLIFKLFAELDEEIIFPLHPRTHKALKTWNINVSSNVYIIEPVGYLEMLALEKNARMILTDSGGVQKEAFFFGIPCVTLRTETEWTEIVDAGWNRVTGLDSNHIIEIVKKWRPATERPYLFGSGDAGESMVKILEREIV